MAGRKATTKEPSDTGQPAPTDQPATQTCKFCGQVIPTSEWSWHLLQHNLLPSQYTEYEPGQPRPEVIECAKVEPIYEPPPPPPPPEPTVEIRLAPVDSNPTSVIVEMRPLCTREFKKGEWVRVPAPDAWVLLPSCGHPGLYAHLRFEMKSEEPKERDKK